MRASFQELVRRYPDPSFRNSFASFACAYRDRDAFREAIRLVGSQVSPHDWIDGTSNEACARWATS
jgi:hypothetical protein